MNGIISSRLIKTDRNGTKYYEGTVKCDRCDGTGTYVWYGAYLGIMTKYSGVCFKCNGYGNVSKKWCERTEEYQAKLDAKRIAKAEKKAEEIRLQEIAKDAEKSTKAIETCNTRKACGCESCPHKVYCSLLSNVLTDLEEGKKAEVLSDTQNALYERLQKVDRTEPVTIETLDGEPCRESKWFTNSFGSSTRCITKPNGEKVYTSATTDNGLARYGLRNRQGA